MSGEIQVVNTEVVRFNLLEDQDFEQADKMFQTIDIYVKRHLRKKIDYGTIPYCGNKPVLFKAGAEKLCRLFKLNPTFEVIEKIVDYKGQLFHYHYRCTLYRQGELVGQCDAIASSKERKFNNKKGFDFSAINTIVKMAQKRALVGAVLIVCGASEYFSQDLDGYDNRNYRR